MRPTISVIIPAYNYARYIGGAIDSVLDQTLVPGEIVVVDDGSTDDTADVVARYAGRGVRYVRKENGGRPRPGMPAYAPARAIWWPSSMPTTAGCPRSWSAR